MQVKVPKSKCVHKVRTFNMTQHRYHCSQVNTVVKGRGILHDQGDGTWYDSVARNGINW